MKSSERIKGIEDYWAGFTSGSTDWNREDIKFLLSEIRRKENALNEIIRIASGRSGVFSSLVVGFAQPAVSDVDA